MSKHTPGPWAVNPLCAQVDAFDGKDGDPLPVCQLLWPTDRRTEATTEANACLIAAAPDLLEALHKVANNWGDLHPKDLHQIRAAIAKAEGR